MVGSETVSVTVPVTALLVYLFQLLPVIFTYLRADCPCDVTTFLNFTFRLLIGSGRVTGSKAIESGGLRVKNPDPVPSLQWRNDAASSDGGLTGRGPRQREKRPEGTST